ncbi:MAG: hypothetical protein WCO42_06425 [bacterium]
MKSSVFSSCVLGALLAFLSPHSAAASTESGIPEWWSVGLAGSRDREQLARSRAIVVGAGSELAAVPLSEVVQWNKLPDGWHGRQALCSLVVAWVMSYPGSGDSIHDRLASKQPLTLDWLAGVTGAASPSILEATWRDWLQRQGQVVQELGALTPDLIEQLRAEVWLQVPVPRPMRHDPISISLSPSEVISKRKQYPAVPMLASAKMMRIQALLAGKAPELVEVGRLYVLFYEGVARGAWSLGLEFRLKRADDALASLAKITRAREAYVNAFEKGFVADYQSPGALPPGEAIPEFEKSRMEAYVDEAEKQEEMRSFTWQHEKQREKQP